MKTLIIFCAGLMLASFTLLDSSKFTAHNSAINTFHSKALAQQTCTINDQSVQNLGTDSVVCSTGAVAVTMPSASTYSATIGSPATSFILNGQTVPFPKSQVVTLPSGGTVQVDWGGSNAITITDIVVIE